MDGIFYETRPSFDRVIVGGICARGNSWDERGLTKKIRIQFFLCIRGVCHVYIRSMAVGKGVTLGVKKKDQSLLVVYIVPMMVVTP